MSSQKSGKEIQSIRLPLPNPHCITLFNQYYTITNERSNHTEISI
jgi:hypothetical protein